MMLRSFLPRPRPILSNLRRQDCRSAAQLGRRADQIISRSYTSDEDETDSDVDRPEAKILAPGSANRYGRTSPNQKRQHLYVVLDDWLKGFSIHKLDLHDGSDGADLTMRAPVLRQAIEDRLRWNFTGTGSKIVAAGKVNSGDDVVTLVYDTETAGLSIVPRLPAAPCGNWCLTTPTENGLYTMEVKSKMDGPLNASMHLLEDAPAITSHEAYLWGTRQHWSWSSIMKPPPFRVTGRQSSAVHPGGTLFVSVGKYHIPDIDMNDDSIGASHIFSYDRGTDEWMRHGEWDMPFLGRAHYDIGLDVWVGLQKTNEPHYCGMTDGYLCCCDVVSPGRSFVQPTSKLCAERLFDPRTYNMGAGLVYMGDSNYCLVEFLARESFKSRRRMDVGNKCEICVTTFRLKYGKNGELTMTSRRPKLSYLFSSFYQNGYCNVRAFWM